MVANLAVGYDNIDVAACTERRILVTNTPDVLTEATADLTFALILAVARRIAESDRYVRAGRWSRWEWNYLWGSEMQGKTLGLYGFGRIAQATARRGRGFGIVFSTTLAAGLRRVSNAISPPNLWTAKLCCGDPIF